MYQGDREDIVQKAIDRGLISLNGNWYSLYNKYKFQGKHNLLNIFNDSHYYQPLLDFLSIDEEIIKDLKNQIKILESEIESLHEDAAGENI